MKILISAQYLDGNSPEGFNHDAWLAALESEYRAIAHSHFPQAVVEVNIDRQRNASGSSRHATVDFVDDEDVNIQDQLSLEFSVEQASNSLYDTRGQEFFE